MALIMVMRSRFADLARPVNVCKKLASRPSRLQCRYSPVSDLGCVNEQVRLINYEGQRSTTWTGVFPLRCSVEQLNLDYLASAARTPSVPAGRASLSCPLLRALYVSLIGM